MQTFRAYIIEYTDKNLQQDIKKLEEICQNKFKPNQKLIDSILDVIYESEESVSDVDNSLRMEIDKFNVIVETACAIPAGQSPEKKRDNIISWLANNGTDPNFGWNTTCDRRFNEIMKKLDV